MRERATVIRESTIIGISIGCASAATCNGDDGTVGNVPESVDRRDRVQGDIPDK